MGIKAIDCSAKLSTQHAHDLKSAGIGAVGRYIGYKNHPYWSKVTTPAEIATIHREGLQIFCIYESNPTRLGYFTKGHGTLDANDVLVEMHALNAPSYAVAFLTVDFNASANAEKPILEYFKEAKAVLGGHFKVGAYGEYEIIELLANAPADTRPDAFMQTYAWSGKQLSKHADIYQWKNDTLLAGIHVDLCDVKHPVGLWPEKVTPPNPEPVQPHIPHHTSVLTLKSRGGDVATLQTYLLKLGFKVVGTADADFGPHTLEGVKLFQEDYHIRVDGVVGPQTWSTLERAVAKLR